MTTPMEPIKPMEMMRIAMYGDVERATIAHNSGNNFTMHFLTVATRNGHYDLLAYAYDKTKDVNNDILLYAAITSNSTECFKFIFDKTKNIKIEEFVKLLQNDKIELVEYVLQNGFDLKGNATEFLRIIRRFSNAIKFEHHIYINDNWCCYGSLITDIAFNTGNCSYITDKIKNNIPVRQHVEFGPQTYQILADNNDMETIKCIKEICNTSMNECITICAKMGHLECMKLFDELGAQWSKFDAHHAAINGHPECLEYILSNSKLAQEVNAYTCAMTARKDHLLCLQILHKHYAAECESWIVLNDALNGKSVRCIEFLMNTINLDNDMYDDFSPINFLNCDVFKIPKKA